MTSIINDRLIKALLKQPVDRTPIWIMRQAGRYLPEYREIKATAGSFQNLCQNPTLACEVTMQPLRRFDLDAAILFSDILTLPDAMGLGLYFNEGEGPCFERPLTTHQDIQQLPLIDPEQDLAYVMTTIKNIKKELNNKLPLIGFAGSPWTMATYMVEGRSSKTFNKIKALMFQDPKTLHLLLSKLSKSVIDYLNAQIKNGVDTVMIFDTWGGVLSEQDYLHFSLQYMQQIIEGLIKTNVETKVPTIVFTKNSGLWLEKIAEIGCDAIGLDWTINIKDAYLRVGHKVALQGNLDPAVLYGTPELIRHRSHKILHDFPHHTGHIFNLGHGIYPDINPEHVKILVDAVHQFKAVKQKKSMFASKA